MTPARTTEPGALREELAREIDPFAFAISGFVLCWPSKPQRRALAFQVADTLLAGPLAPILANRDRLTADLAAARDLNRILHRRTQKAERFRARWGGSFATVIIAKIKERRGRLAAEADRDRLAAQVEAMRAERDRWRDVLWSVCGRLELPRSEPSGPADDPVLYERVIDDLEDTYRQAERERVTYEARMHSAEAALVRFAEIAKGIPFHVADAAPVARITQDAKHSGTITTLTAADFRRAEKVLDAARSALGLPEPEGESR